MRELSHESLTVYQRSIDFVRWASEFVDTATISGVILDQFKRSFISIPLNIAEGAGKGTPKDQARLNDIARGSALECGACLDVMVAMRLVETQKTDEGKKMLGTIVAMLTALRRSITGQRTREDGSEYSILAARC